VTKLELLRLAHEKGWLFSTPTGSLELGHEETGEIIEARVNEDSGEFVSGTYLDMLGIEHELSSLDEAADIVRNSPRRLRKSIKRIEL
jgi:hypothetical protein